MAQFVNQRCKTKWDYKAAKSRYCGYRKLYNAAKRECDKTGFGLTDDDIRKGVTSTVPMGFNNVQYFMQIIYIFFELG